jgi:hypothetical protein
VDLTDQVKKKVENTPDKTKRWFVRLGRIGFAAKGTVYLVLGLLVFKAAFGLERADLDIQDALLEIGSQAYGKWMLLLVAAGLAGFVIWQFARAVFDPDRAGTGWKGTVKRLGYAVTGVAYSVVALTALQFIVEPAGSQYEGADELAFKVMFIPVGRSFILAAGLVVLGLGIAHLFKIFGRGLTDNLKAGQATRTVRRWTKWLGRLGSFARSIIFGVTGVLLLQAALFNDPYRAGGLGTGLRTLAFSPYGPWIMIFMAFGLISYGIYWIVTALFFSIRIP